MKMERPRQKKSALDLLQVSTILVLLLVAILLLASCGATPTPAPPTPTPAPPTLTPVPPTATPASLNTMIDVGGYKLEIHCDGAGNPPIIVENGFIGYIIWSTNVRKFFQTQATVCTYQRAGAGLSEKAPKSPRTSADMVEDLHTLLGKAGIKPPYLLVGYNFGGLNARLYASRYAAEVAGLVLVDAYSTDDTLALCSLTQADAEKTAVRQARLGWCGENDLRNVPSEGGIDMVTSDQQVKASGKLGSIPLVVLARSPNSRPTEMYPAGFPDDLAAKIEQQHAALQKDLLSLSTRSTYLVATTAGFLIWSEEPEAVYSAIQAALKQVRGQ